MSKTTSLLRSSFRRAPLATRSAIVVAVVAIAGFLLTTTHAQPTRTPVPVRILEVAVTPGGLRTLTPEVEEGEYLLIIRNKDFLSPIPFQLDRGDNNARVATPALSRGASGSATRVMMSPGRHVLSVPGIPQFRADINVTPRAAR